MFLLLEKRSKAEIPTIPIYRCWSFTFRRVFCSKAHLCLKVFFGAQKRIVGVDVESEKFRYSLLRQDLAVDEHGNLYFKVTQCEVKEGCGHVHNSYLWEVIHSNDLKRVHFINILHRCN